MTPFSRGARRVIRGACRATSAMSVIAFVVLAATTILAAPGEAAPTAGEAQIVAPQDGSPAAGRPLAEGKADTAFSLALPAGAACTGDSTDGGYRVQSFMIPDAVDPAGLTFGALGPLPKGVGADFRQPLYQVSSAAFANAATNLADEPGGPGTIINIPSFSLAVLSSGDLPNGRYRLGIACTKGPAGPGQLDRYWAAPLVLATSSEPGGAHTWTAPSAPPPPAAAADTADGTTPTTGVAPEDAATATTGAAEEPAPVEPAGSRASAPSGAPPSFRYPAAALASQLSVAGGTARSLVLWLVLALVAGRAAFLLARTPRVVAVAMR